jgi:hypothetical protein
MIIHVEGTNTPGAPALPECVKADVYLPPVFMSEHPEAHPAIAQIVQIFIEEVGIPTIQRWTHAGKKCGWSLSQSGHVYRNQGSTTRPLVPSPVSGTSRYQFHGRPYGNLTQSVSSDHSHNNNFPVSPHAEPAMSQDSDIICDLESLSQTALDFANSIEEITKLKGELEGAEHREDNLIQQIHTLFSHLQGRMQKLLVFRPN